ncbi:MAG: filamentous hemagglutinin N-terminal domain-containing protein [Magnetococcales bacterium]|nr:filamentous hemagglutinin N-terminal domain-containing protein [Magnetococcales bacterium]MBF0115052.1 filamentous hemagglutinin N-terminal domain-containing protein [Magnetococcales bacterium]
MQSDESSPNRPFGQSCRRINAKSLLKVHAVLLGLGCGLVVPHTALALPSSGSVVSGSATITESAKSLSVLQNSNKLMLDWRSFSIKSGEQVNFLQPSASAVAINRVTGKQLSQIAGTMRGNGHVVLVNPNGIVFQGSARVELGSLLATSHWISKEDFEADRMHFVSPSSAAEAKVINHGVINAAEGGTVLLAAPYVENSGVIQAHLGHVALAASDNVTVRFEGSKLGYDVPANSKMGKALQAVNNGTLQANGGTVLMSTSAKEEIMNSVVSMGGRIEAKAVDVRNGRVILHAGMGTSQVSGSVDVSGQGSGEKGGSVEVTGDTVRVTESARLNASGDAGGGTLKIGGDRQGKNPQVQNARKTTIAKGATLTADALRSGNGGQIIIWSDKTTAFQGNLSVRGGSQSGDGGFVEISGKEKLLFAGQVDAGAAKGKQGTLLLDPDDIYIESVDSCSSDACSSISPQTLADITANIDLQANNTIQFTAEVSLANGVSLSATAGGDIYIQKEIIVNGADLTFTSSGGNIQFSGEGAIRAEANTVTLIAEQGKITVASTTNTHITAANLVLRSATGIGHSDDNNPLNTAIDTLSFVNSTSGTVRIRNSEGMTVSGEQSTQGDIILTSSEGDITVNTLSTTDAIQLAATEGAIKAGIDATFPHITANSLNLSAKTGIGVDRVLMTHVDTLTLSMQDVASGNVLLANDKSINVGGTYGGSGSIQISTSTGDLALDGLLAADATVTLSAAGNITGNVLSGDTSYHLTANAAELSADGGIGASSTLLTQLNSLSFHSAGNVDITNSLSATGALTIDNSDYANANTISIEHSSGDIRIRSITPRDDSSASLTITAAAGQILNDNSSASDINLSADQLYLTASSHIGALDKPLQTSTNTLTFTTQGGDVYLKNDKSLLGVTGSYSGTGTISLETANSGDITLRSITSSDQSPQGKLVLIASGRLLGDGGTSPHIEASSADLTTKGGIGSSTTKLETSVTSLSFNNSESGEVWISNSGSVTVESGVQSAGDSLNLIVGNHLTIKSITASDTVNLTAGGSIKAEGSGSTHIKAQYANLQATSGIGTESGTPQLATEVDRLKFFVSNGSVSLTNSKSLRIGDDSSASDDRSASGDVTISNSAGDLTIGKIDVGDSTVTLSSVGMILGDDTCPINIIAGTAKLTASTQIGTDSSSPLHTQVDRLEFDANSGHVYISNNKSMTVLGEFDNGNTLWIKSSGSMTVESITSTTADSLTSQLTLIAEEQVIAGQSNTSRHVDADLLTIDAGKGIGSDGQPLIGQVDHLSFSNSGSGEVWFSNNRALSVSGTFQNGGHVTLAVTESGDLTVQKLATVDDTSSGSVSLAVSDGRILGSSTTTDTQVTTDTLTLSANKGIGADDGASGVIEGLTTAINVVNFTSTGGDLYLTNTQDLSVAGTVLRVKGTYQGASTINLTSNTGSLQIESIASIPENDLQQGIVTLTASAGQITGFGTGTHVKADALDLNSATGVGASNLSFATSVNTLTFNNTSSGNVEIKQDGSLTVTGKQQEAGEIKITVSSGDMTVHALSGNDLVTLQIDQGTIKGETGQTTSHLVAPSADITVHSGNGDDILTSNVAALTFDVTTEDSAMAIHNAGSWTVTGTVQAGSVELVTESGDIHVSQIASSDPTLTGTVTLWAKAGAVIGDDIADAASHITADQLILKATTGIGSDDPLRTSVNALTFDSGNADLQLTNTADLAVSGHYQESGFIQITTKTGDLMVGAITADSANATIKLTATAGQIQSDGSGTVEADTLYLSASSDIGTTSQLSTQINTLDFDLTSGSIYLRNHGRAMRVTGVSKGSVSEVDLGSDTGDLTIDSIAPESTNGSASIASIKLYADNGSIIGSANQPALVAEAAALTASTGIGSSIQPFRTTVSQLTYDNTASGDVYLINSQNVTIASGQNGMGGSTTIVAETGNLTVQSIVASDLSLLAMEGSILAETTESATHLTADSVSLQAVSGIGLSMAVNSLSFENENNATDLTNSKSIILTDGKVTGNGTVNISVSNGDLTIGSISLAESISLTTLNGSIIGQNSDTAAVTASKVTFSASESIHGESNTAFLTNVKTVQLNNQSSTGDAFITNNSSATFTGTLVGTGTVELTVQEGDITLDQLTVSNHVILTAQLGAIEELNGTQTNLTAGKAILVAGRGIGGTDGVHSEVNSMEFSNDQGNVVISNESATFSTIRGSITDSGVVYFKQTTGDAVIDSITANQVELEVTNGNLTGSSQSSIHITANDAKLTASTGLGSTTTPLMAAVAILDFNNTGEGNVYIRNTDSLQVSGLHQGTNENNISISAQFGDLTVNKIAASNSHITLTSSAGNIIAQPSIPTHIIGADLVLNAENGDIGSSENILNTQVNQLGFNAGNDFFLSNSSALTITTGVAGSALQVHAESINGNENTNSLQAPTITLTTESGIGNTTPVNTVTDHLIFTNTSGNIHLVNSGSFTVQGKQSGGGTIDISNTVDTITLDNIVAESATVEMNAGSITGIDGNTHIEANSVILNAAHGIGNDSPIVISAPHIHLDNSTSGDIHLLSDGVTNSFVSATNSATGGKITLTAATGDMTLNKVEGGGGVYVQSREGFILAAEGNLITAPELTLQAVYGAGEDSNPISMSIDQLTANVELGSLYVKNDRDLALNTLAAGDTVSIQIDKNGMLNSNQAGLINITANKAVLYTNGIGETLEVTSDVRLLELTNNINGVNINNSGTLKISGSQSGNGDLVISNTDDLHIGTIVSNGQVSLTSQSNIWFESDGKITVPVSAATPNRTLSANRSYSSNPRPVALADASGAAEIGVSLYAPNGTIGSLDQSTNANIIAPFVDLNAGFGVGSKQNKLRLQVNSLRFSQSYGAGQVWVTNSSTSLSLGNITTNSIFNFSQSGNLVITEPLTVGGLTLDVTNGSLTINEGAIITSTGTDTSGGINLTASGGIFSFSNLIKTIGAPVTIDSEFTYTADLPRKTTEHKNSTIRYSCLNGVSCLSNADGIAAEETEFTIITNGGDIQFKKITATANPGGEYGKLEVYLLAGKPVDAADGASYQSLYPSIDGGRVEGELDVWNAYVSASSAALKGIVAKAAKFSVKNYSKEAAEVIYTFPYPHNGDIKFNGYGVPGVGRPNNFPGPYILLLARSSSDLIPDKTSNSDWVLDTSENPVLYKAMQKREEYPDLANDSFDSSPDASITVDPSYDSNVISIGVNYDSKFDRTGDGTEALKYNFFAMLSDLKSKQNIFMDQLDLIGYGPISFKDSHTYDTSTRKNILKKLTKYVEIYNKNKTQGISNKPLIVYFTGHGLLYKNNGYWVPSDAYVNEQGIMKNLISSDDIYNIFKNVSQKNSITLITDACTPGNLAVENVGAEDKIYSMSASRRYANIFEKIKFRNQADLGATIFSDKLLTVIKQRNLETTRITPDQLRDEIFFMVRDSVHGWQDWSKRSRRILVHKPQLGVVEMNPKKKGL